MKSRQAASVGLLCFGLVSWPFVASADDLGPKPTGRRAPATQNEAPASQNEAPAAQIEGRVRVFVEPTLESLIDRLSRGTAYFVQRASAGDDPQPAPSDEYTRGKAPVAAPDHSNLKFWLGIATGAPDEALRAQIGLSEEHGVIVNDVAPDSPAAKAGLKKFDVILKVQGQPVTMPGLIDAVQKSQEQPLKLEVFRGGKAIDVQVAPAKRPQAGELEIQVAPEGAPNDNRVFKFWDLRRQGKPGDILRWHQFGPGAVIINEAAELPDGVAITIHREGKNPAKITVRKDDKTWIVSEKDLNNLPDDLRAHVERMLQPHPWTQAFGGDAKIITKELENELKDLPRMFKFAVPLPPGAVPPIHIAPPGVAPQAPRPEGKSETDHLRSLEQAVREMQRQMELRNNALEAMIRQLEERLNKANK